MFRVSNNRKQAEEIITAQAKNPGRSEIQIHVQTKNTVQLNIIIYR